VQAKPMIMSEEEWMAELGGILVSAGLVICRHA